MAWTWSTDVTLGRVSRNPSVRPPSRTRAAEEQVEGAQAAPTRGRLEGLEPDPVERRGVPVVIGQRRALAATTAAASSSGSPRFPNPSSKSIRRSSIGSVSSFWRTSG